MNLPPGFFFRPVKLMPEYEPDDFSLSLSFSSLLILYCWELFQLIAWGPMTICFLQLLWPPRTPQMDPILGVHWNHPSCPLPVLTEKNCSPLSPHGNQVTEGTFFHLQWTHSWAGHRQAKSLAYFLQLMMCQTDQPTVFSPKSLPGNKQKRLQ